MLTSVVVQAQCSLPTRPKGRCRGPGLARSNLAAPAPKAPDGKPDLVWGCGRIRPLPPAHCQIIRASLVPGGAPPIPGTPPSPAESQGALVAGSRPPPSTSAPVCPAAFRSSPGRWRSRSSAWQDNMKVQPDADIVCRWGMQSTCRSAARAQHHRGAEKSSSSSTRGTLGHRQDLPGRATAAEDYWQPWWYRLLDGQVGKVTRRGAD